MASVDRKLTIHTAFPQQTQPAPAKRQRRLRIKTRLTLQERLLRNSCLACAVLLGVMTLGSISHPWAQKVSGHIEEALTMEIDLDKSLGKLSFVQKLMPESALVFFNLSGANELLTPVQAELSHAYSPNQPWLMFRCTEETPVCACADGTVAAVSSLSDGLYGILIDHGDGRESVTACLSACSVETGDALLRGAAIGSGAENLYFELREGGEAIDPTELMGL